MRPPHAAPPPLGQEATRYRLVPLGRSEPDTTSWTVMRRLATQPRGAALQVMVARSHGQTTVDSVLFNRRTLILISEHLHGGTSVAVRVSGSRVTGEARDSTTRPIDVATPGFAYSSTMDNLVVRSLPLAPGYTAVLPFWDGDHIELDTVRVRAQDAGGPAWLVDFAEPYAVETLWIERASRRIVRHVYTWRRDGTRSEVIAEDRE